ncbi:MAG: diphosphomevalonate decarboxylase [Gemmatimonadota bacterium]
MSVANAGPALRVATWTAPANIAFVKYWGSHDPDAGLPLNPSLSMTLSHCTAACTVRRSPVASVRVFRADGHDGVAPAPAALADPVAAHVRRVMHRAGQDGGADVAVAVDFPVAAGLASSAAIFAAVTRAAADAFGLDLDSVGLADLARSAGSGSAARSMAGGYVEWTLHAGRSALDVVAPASHWDLRDVIAVVDAAPKRVSSREGHRRALTSPYFQRRLTLVDDRLARTRDAILRRDVAALGIVAEEEALDLHLIAMSARPPFRYWRAATLAILDEVEAMRREGVSAWSTMDAGPNVHVLCEPHAEDEVARRLTALGGTRRIIRDRVGQGPAPSVRHLL